MKNKIIKLVTIILIASLAFCGCSDSDSQTENTTPENLIPQQGGSITLGCFVPDTLNPLVTEYQNVRDVLMIVYEGREHSQSHSRNS